MSVHRCCLDCPTGCCQVGGPEPTWLNRYCFELRTFVYLHRNCECNDFLNPCERCPEPGNCDAETIDPVNGHADCIECCREREIRLCASGALFRTPLSVSGCASTSDNPDALWSSICSAGTYTPPNIDNTVGGVTSFYSSPPCDCALSGNDRVTWSGNTRNEDVNGCCDADDYDQPINCVSGQATIECAEEACDTTRFPCCSLTGTRTHYLKVSLHTAGATGISYHGCTCDDPIYVPDLRFVFAAELGRSIGPHQATWELVGVEEITDRPTGTFTQFTGDCAQPPLGELPCNEPGCCPDPPDPCCSDCAEWTCNTCSQASCQSCFEASFGYPTLQLTSYQNCTTAPCT